MRKKVKVLFDGKAFYPEEPIELESDTHYTAIIEKAEKRMPNQTLKKIQERAIDFGISDLARQHDHYLYGTRKR